MDMNISRQADLLHLARHPLERIEREIITPRFKEAPVEYVEPRSNGRRGSTAKARITFDNVNTAFGIHQRLQHGRTAQPESRENVAHNILDPGIAESCRYLRLAINHAVAAAHDKSLHLMRLLHPRIDADFIPFNERLIDRYTEGFAMRKRSISRKAEADGASAG